MKLTKKEEEIASLLISEIKNRLSEKLHKELVVDWVVDADIIAGLIINVNDVILDNSVRHKLDDLTKNIGIG